MAHFLSRPSSFLRRSQHNSQQKIRQASIFNYVVLNITLVVTFIVIFSGIPAIYLLRYQLGQHAYLQVQNAQSATLALYRAESNRLLKLVELSSERPTLKSLVNNGEKKAISQYLDSIRKDTSEYILRVITPDLELIESGSSELNLPGQYLINQNMPFADLVALEDQNRAAFIAVDEIRTEEPKKTEPLGWVVGIQILDDQLMHTLFEQTGVEQSIILNGLRVASSIQNSDDLAIDAETISSAKQSNSTCCSIISNKHKSYYVGIAPLVNNEEQVVAFTEVALPGDTIQKMTRSSIGYFIGSSIIIALIGVALSTILTRRITQPLTSLAQAVERKGYGDLNTPIPVRTGWIEIDQLAAQLERSRQHLKQILYFSRSELKRVIHLLGATKEGLVILNEDGNLTWFNSEILHITGYKPKDLFNKHHSQVFRPLAGDVPPLDGLLYSNHDQLLETHLNILNAQDKPITLSVSLTKLDDDKGMDEHNELVLTIRDINRDQEINRLRGDFLTYIAHEFQTPLASISAVIELLEEYGLNLTSQELENLVSNLRLSSTHLNAIVNNLLESTIIEAGCFQLNYRPIHIDELLDNLSEIIMPLIGRQNQILKLDFSKDLPTFWADPDRLRQALVNLLDNASKFSPAGSNITLEVRKHNDKLVFAVFDSGPGLSQIELDNIFDHFVAREHPSGSQFGIGLGLPVVRAIVEAHGGEFKAENRPEGGAKVWFTINLIFSKTRENAQWQRYLW